LRYKNDKLIEVLHSLVEKNKNNLNLYNLALVINSYAALVPDKIDYFNDLAPELHDKLSAGVKTDTFKLGEHINNPDLVNFLIPDLTTYVNLWLAITCYAVKQGNSH
jgi:hypothetical protein